MGLNTGEWVLSSVDMHQSCCLGLLTVCDE